MLTSCLLCCPASSARSVETPFAAAFDEGHVFVSGRELGAAALSTTLATVSSCAADSIRTYRTAWKVTSARAISDSLRPSEGGVCIRAHPRDIAGRMGHAAGMSESESAIEDILRFWFGELRAPDDVDRTKMKMWWMGGAAIDDEIERRFGSKVADALEGKLGGWMETPRGCLALVILLDQFTRNIGRGTANAFAGDRAALDACLTAIDRG